MALSSHFFKGCSSNLRTNSSNPSDCSRILPAEGETSWAALTVWPLTRIVIRSLLAEAIDLGPLAERALDVIFAAGVEQLLEVGVVPRPPELTVSGEDPWLPPFLPPRPFVGPEDDRTGESHGDRLPFGVLAADDDQVAHATLGELALDRRHPHAPGPAVRAGRMQQDAGVPDELPAVGPLAPLVFDDQVIIAIRLLGGDVAVAVAGDVQHAVRDPEDLAWVLVLRVLEPGG